MQIAVKPKFGCVFLNELYTYPKSEYPNRIWYVHDQYQLLNMIIFGKIEYSSVFM